MYQRRSGFVFTFYEQYVDVVYQLTVRMCIAVPFVALASWLFLVSPWAAVLMTSMLVAVLLEVLGFLYFLNLKINGVCVVNLVMSIGFSVEFTAHIARVFMMSRGSSDERAQNALRVMFIPTVNGAISTLLGVLPMGFANFPYFKLYFFNQYFLPTA
jgi:multidrug efflux pump subunit AcrB